MANTTKTLKDDLSEIKGIGEKYVEILKEAGVDTYSKLAALTEEQLDKIIADSEARRPASLNTWIKQANDLNDTPVLVNRQTTVISGEGVTVINQTDTQNVDEFFENDRMNSAFQQFVEHESRAIKAGRESLLSWIPEDVRKHGTDAVNEFIASYRALLSPIMPKKDSNKSKIEIR